VALTEAICDLGFGSFVHFSSKTSRKSPNNVEGCQRFRLRVHRRLLFFHAFNKPLASTVRMAFVVALDFTTMYESCVTFGSV
jgi:hypothetical protein